MASCMLIIGAWIRVLSNIEPPPLRRNAAVDKLIAKTDLHAKWPLHNYVFLPPRNCLPARRHLWTDTHPTNIISQWPDKWKSAPVVNSSLLDDPTIRQPAFDDLPRHY